MLELQAGRGASGVGTSGCGQETCHVLRPAVRSLLVLEYSYLFGPRHGTYSRYSTRPASLHVCTCTTPAVELPRYLYICTGERCCGVWTPPWHPYHFRSTLSVMYSTLRRARVCLCTCMNEVVERAPWWLRNGIVIGHHSVNRRP